MPVTMPVPAVPVRTMAIPVDMLPATGEQSGQTPPAAGGNVPSSLLPDKTAISALFAFQAAPASLPGNGETPQKAGEAGDAGMLLVPVQNDTGSEMAPKDAKKTTAESGQAVTTEPSPETTEILLAATLQLLSQPVPTSQLPKRPDVSESSDRSAVKTVNTVNLVNTVNPVDVNPTGSVDTRTKGAQPAVAVTVPGLSVPAQPASMVEPALRMAVATPVAEIAKDQKVTASQAVPIEADRVAMPMAGEERSALAAQFSGKPLKAPVRGAHDPVSVRGTEAPAPAASGQIFNRPLLEVVVEDAVTNQSAELAAKPAKADLSSDLATVGKSPQTLIGGAGAMKVEPAVLPTAGEAVKAPSHEQILAQVKEQLGKAEFRADDGRVVLRLHPEELGSLRIDVKLDDQRLRLHIVAENPAVREALTANMDSLKETLSRQQIVVDRFEVTSGQGHDQQQLFKEHRQQVLDGRGNRPGRILTAQAEDDEVVGRRAMNAYWAPQESSLLDVRF
ncbi:flagellar hook-length control protein FliK [Geobacter argillaceus]|uniref:Flagellar hook-length control protein FliK n=2 Tax=Geobacter argillaceus TaxID=345631 RepID=A0A562VJA7_9BACT|nr:flagellar hook-length control protein FliK [Geobacter argillaceus]